MSLPAAIKWRVVQLSAAVAKRAPEVAGALAPLAGDLAWLLAAGPRAAVADNLCFLQPAAEPALLRRQARSVFRSVASYYVDLLRLPALNARWFDRRLRVDGYEHLAAAVARGTGVIIAGLHLGPAEIVLQGLSARGIRYTAMVERLDPPQVAALLLRIRESHGETYLYPSMRDTKRLIRVLRGGGVVAMLIDRDVLGTGIEASFCGGTVRVPVGAIELARLTGATVIPAAARWRSGRLYGVTVMPPFVPAAGRKDHAGLRRDIERLLAVLEPHLRRAPGDWLVLQRLWPAPTHGRGAAYTGLHADL